MKRILLCAVLCLASVLAWGQTVVDSGTCGADGDNLTWELTDDGTLTISGTGEMVDYPNSYNYPWVFDDIQVAVIEEGVTSIGECAFEGCTSLTAVTIPGSVTSMGEYAFSRTGLTQIGHWDFPVLYGNEKSFNFSQMDRKDSLVFKDLAR